MNNLTRPEIANRLQEISSGLLDRMNEITVLREDRTMEAYEILSRVQSAEMSLTEILSELVELREDLAEAECGCLHLASEHHHENGCTICDCMKFSK